MFYFFTDLFSPQSGITAPALRDNMHAKKGGEAKIFACVACAACVGGDLGLILEALGLILEALGGLRLAGVDREAPRSHFVDFGETHVHLTWENARSQRCRVFWEVFFVKFHVAAAACPMGAFVNIP